MNTPRTHRFVAFTMSLLATLVIFSSVASLATPAPALQLLVQADAGPLARG